MVKCPFAAKGCNYPEGDCPGHCLVDNGLRQDPFEALRLADALTNPRRWHDMTDDDCEQAAAELRRLHAENEDFRATIDHLTRENAAQIGEIVALKEQRAELLTALHLALEYWAHREQRYKNRSPVWVQKSRAAIARAGGAA